MTNDEEKGLHWEWVSTDPSGDFLSESYRLMDGDLDTGFIVEVGGDKELCGVSVFFVIDENKKGWDFLVAHHDYKGRYPGDVRKEILAEYPQWITRMVELLGTVKDKIHADVNAYLNRLNRQGEDE